MGKTLILLSFLLITGSCTKSSNSLDVDITDEKNDQLKTDDKNLSLKKAILKTIHGNITIKFYPKHAPNTVTRFMNLVENGFYNGLKFHRVIPNFVVQTGDPTGTGTGGSGQKLKAEFNEIQHIKGTVAMARAQSPDSGDSQFYIALSTLPHLDKKYTVFGQVTKGLEILDKISKGDQILNFSLINK
ncbi:MAG: peptidylprolyl isomerase [Bacteriovoracaceae bacterium]